jgi:hypothetical protein
LHLGRSGKAQAECCESLGVNSLKDSKKAIGRKSSYYNERSIEKLFMNQDTKGQILLEKILKLPSERIGEIENFVDFLLTKESEQQMIRAAAKLSEPSFAAVWDNSDDAVYDDHRV